MSSEKRTIFCVKSPLAWLALKIHVSICVYVCVYVYTYIYVHIYMYCVLCPPLYVRADTGICMCAYSV